MTSSSNYNMSEIKTGPNYGAQQFGVGKKVQQVASTLASLQEALKLLAELEQEVNNSTAIPSEEKGQITKYLNEARSEISKKEPNMPVAHAKLESFGEALKRFEPALNAAVKILPTVEKIAGFLGG